VRDVERHSRMTESSAEAVWNGGMGIVPVGKEVAASCVTAATFNVCALLHSTRRTQVRPCVRVRILPTLFTALVQGVHTLPVNFYV
jgi:hypothetical protein